MSNHHQEISPTPGEDLVTKVSQTQSSSNNASSTQQLAYNTSGSDNGTVSSITNSDGNTTTYSYDSNGNLSEVAPPSPQNPTY